MNPNPMRLLKGALCQFKPSLTDPRGRQGLRHTPFDQEAALAASPLNKSAVLRRPSDEGTPSPRRRGNVQHQAQAPATVPPAPPQLSDHRAAYRAHPGTENPRGIGRTHIPHDCSPRTALREDTPPVNCWNSCSSEQGLGVGENFPCQNYHPQNCCAVVEYITRLGAARAEARRYAPRLRPGHRSADCHVATLRLNSEVVTSKTGAPWTHGRRLTRQAVTSRYRKEEICSLRVGRVTEDAQ